LAEDQHPRLVVARDDELFGNQVHPVMQTPNVADVGHTKKSEDIGGFVVSFAEMMGWYPPAPKRRLIRSAVSVRRDR